MIRSVTKAQNYICILNVGKSCLLPLTVNLRILCVNISHIYVIKSILLIVLKGENCNKACPAFLLVLQVLLFLMSIFSNHRNKEIESILAHTLLCHI